MNPVIIADRPIGPDEAPLLLPDIGTFFNQDTALAKTMIKQLKKSGAVIVKGEILHDPNVCLDDGTVESYYSYNKSGLISESYRELIERKALSFNAYEEIFSECREQNLPFVVSVYDVEGANFSYDLGVSALKIASSNIVHEALIRHIAKIGLPMIIDTGYSTMDEIARGVGWARESGAKDIVVEYSPPAPPEPVCKQNIRVLHTLATALDCHVGLSDHHHGPEMLYAAAALGASVVEKGICQDGSQEDQDVAHALPIGQFEEVNRVCQLIKQGLGDGVFPAEVKHKKSRMCITTGDNDRAEGEVLSMETVGFAWPVKGVPVENWSLVEGWKLRHKMSKGVPITWADIEP